MLDAPGVLSGPKGGRGSATSGFSCGTARGFRAADRILGGAAVVRGPWKGSVRQRSAGPVGQVQRAVLYPADGVGKPLGGEISSSGVSLQGPWPTRDQAGSVEERVLQIGRASCRERGLVSVCAESDTTSVAR